MCKICAARLHERAALASLFQLHFNQAVIYSSLC